MATATGKDELGLISATALQTLLMAQGSGDPNVLDVDEACKLARDVSLDPNGAFALMDKRFGRANADPAEVYEGVIDTTLTSRYDDALLTAVSESDSERSGRETIRARAMSAASSLGVDRFGAAVDTGDESVVMKAAERMYYN